MSAAVRLDVLRPVTRGDCAHGPRPCPWSSCRHHLDARSASCVLDVAEAGGLTHAEIGALLGVTGARIGQIEQAAFVKLADAARRLVA